MTETTPAPDIDTIECAAEILGCSSWFQGQTRIVCETHSNTDWPCPETVGLATKLAARDACRDAEKSALIRVVLDDVDTQRAQTPFLDEFVARGVNVHFEAMSNAQFWIGVDFDDGTKWSINCGAVNPNAKGYAFAEQDSP